MSREHTRLDEPGASESEHAAEPSEALEKPSWLRDMPYWSVAALLHIILLLVLAALYLDGRKEAKVQTVITLRPPKPAPPLRVMLEPGRTR